MCSGLRSKKAPLAEEEMVQGSGNSVSCGEESSAGEGSALERERKKARLQYNNFIAAVLRASSALRSPEMKHAMRYETWNHNGGIDCRLQ